MGAVEFSIDVELAALLRDELGIETFVETGTFEGAAIERVRPLFDDIYSIELSTSCYDQVRARFADDAAVRLYHGDGAATLASLAPALRDRAALYWLDAHWCVADGTAGESSQCPLLRELSAIACLNSTSAILIDDARLFLSPPPHPHESADWPSFQDVLDALESLSGDHELMVLNDVIIWFPRTARAALVQHARRRGVDVLASVSRARSLEEELATVKEAADERLAAIGELTRIAEERLAAIEELTRVAEERLALIDQLTAAVHALQSNIGAHGSGDAPPASSGAGA